MKRLRRVIFNGLTMLSLMLCVGTVGLWVRSRLACDGVFYGSTDREKRQGREISAQNTIGYILISINRYTYEKPEGFEFYEQVGPLNGPKGFSRWTADSYMCNLNDWHASYGFYLNGQRSNLPRVIRISAPSVSLGAMRGERVGVLVPHFVVVLLTSIAPLRWLALRRRRLMLSRRGICPKCSYDLRATPERCPECGAIPEKVKA